MTLSVTVGAGSFLLVWAFVTYAVDLPIFVYYWGFPTIAEYLASSPVSYDYDYDYYDYYYYHYHYYYYYHYYYF